MGRGVPPPPHQPFGAELLAGVLASPVPWPCYELAGVGDAGVLIECLRMQCFRAGVSICLCWGYLGGVSQCDVQLPALL